MNPKNPMTPLKLKSTAERVVICIVIVSLIAYCIINFTQSYVADDLVTVRAEIEYRHDVLELTGYVFRDEDVIYSPGGVTQVTYLVGDGEKAGNKQVVARLSGNRTDTVVKSSLEALDRKLSILERSKVDPEYTRVIVENIKSDIKSKHQTAALCLAVGDVAGAVKERDEILILINKQQLITHEMTQSAFNMLISTVETSRVQIAAEEAASRVFSGGDQISAPHSGVFYTAADGYEDIFTSDKIKNLTLTDFRSLIKTEANDTVRTQAVGKITRNDIWYLVCETTKSDCAGFFEEDIIELVFPFSNNQAIKTKLIKKTESVLGDDCLLIFESNISPANFSFTRRQSVEIVTESVSGIRVPEESIHVVEHSDGSSTEGVYVRIGKEVHFRKLNKEDCIGRYEGYYLYLDADTKKKLAAEAEKKRAAEAEKKTGVIIAPTTEAVTQTEEVDSQSEETETDESIPQYQELRLYEEIITYGKGLYDGMKLT
ncbi:hypothetical protein FACS1894219_00810 [Clostridia bacterium]|nr:hypothetical protein FACS1894219_00810 [Clostridia bacterium]